MVMNFLSTMRRAARQKILIYCISFVLALLIFRYMNTREVDWDSLVPKDDQGRAHRKVEKHDKWIVVTSIQKPTYQVKQLAKIPGWKLVVVGDRRSPPDWKLPGVVYLDTTAQKDLRYRIHKFLSYDSYTRKAIGYLYAIEHGATFIYETDDDNEPYDNLQLFHTSHTSPIHALAVDTKNLTFNPYPHFGQSSLWPRGYPLDDVGSDQMHVYKACESGSVPAIQQGLVNGDPDVDAMFRLTRKHEGVRLDLTFDGSAPMVVLPRGVFAPYNSQNTMVSARAFWSLILPRSVSNRACDIYRSYWAQRLLWLTGADLAFLPPTAYQRRNPHSAVGDAAEEFALYQNMGRYVKFLAQWECNAVFFFDCARSLTEELIVLGFLERQDLELIDAWFTDLATIGYIPPTLKTSTHVCGNSEMDTVLFYASEQNTTMSYTPQSLSLPVLNQNTEDNTNTVAEYCGKSTAFCVSKNSLLMYKTHKDILLIVSIHSTKVIPVIDTVYRPFFSNILYCGRHTDLRQLEHDHKISYTSSDTVNAVHCMSRAIELGYNVHGYLHISSSMLLRPQSVASWNQDHVWAMVDPQVYKPEVMEQCNTESFPCIGFTLQKLGEFQQKLEMLEMGESLKQRLKQCFQKAARDENLKHNTGVKYLRDPAFYLPKRLLAAYKNVVALFDGVESEYSFFAFILMDCMELVTEYLHATNINELEGVKSDVIVPFNFEAMAKKADLRKVYCDLMEKMCG